MGTTTKPHHPPMNSTAYIASPCSLPLCITVPLQWLCVTVPLRWLCDWKSSMPPRTRVGSESDKAAYLPVLSGMQSDDL